MNTVRRVMPSWVAIASPFARSNSVYSHVSNQEMLTAALQGLVDRYKLHGLRPGRRGRWRRDEAFERLQPGA